MYSRAHVLSREVQNWQLTVAQIDCTSALSKPAPSDANMFCFFFSPPLASQCMLLEVENKRAILVSTFLWRLSALQFFKPSVLSLGFRQPALGISRSWIIFKGYYPGLDFFHRKNWFLLVSTMS